MYCTISDLELAIPRRTLAQLSNDTPGVQEPNAEVVQRALDHASELIDGKLRSRYSVPLPEVPTVVREIAVHLARHWLYARRPEGGNDLPPAVVRLYKWAMDTLTDIQKGNISLGIVDGSGSSGGGDGGSGGAGSSGNSGDIAVSGKAKVRVNRRLFPQSELDKY